MFGKKSETAPIRESKHTGPATVADCAKDYAAASDVRTTAEKQWAHDQRTGRR